MRHIKKEFKNPYFVLNHTIADFINCRIGYDMLNSSSFLRDIADRSIALLGSKVMNMIEFNFKPHGYTFIAILSGSSFTLHSWPEESFVSVDIFTCTEENEHEKVLEFIKEKLQATNVYIHRINRPYLNL